MGTIGNSLLAGVPIPQGLSIGCWRSQLPLSVEICSWLSRSCLSRRLCTPLPQSSLQPVTGCWHGGSRGYLLVLGITNSDIIQASGPHTWSGWTAIPHSPSTVPSSCPHSLLVWVCVCTQLCLTLCNPMDCSPPGSSVHGISQARILEQVAISCSQGSSWPQDQTYISCTAHRFFTNEPPGKAPKEITYTQILLWSSAPREPDLRQYPIHTHSWNKISKNNIYTYFMWCTLIFSILSYSVFVPQTAHLWASNLTL